MKAIQYRAYGEPDVLEYRDVADPVAAEGEVVVRLETACVAPLDWKMRAGILQQHFALTFPAIPGRDGVGIVESVGDGVNDLKPGDRVCVMAGHARQGTYAEKIAVPRRSVALAPANLDAVHAVAGLNAGVNAWTCFDMAAIQPGQRVLVHGGSGAVGGILVQLCSKRGDDVVTTCRSANRDYVLGLGASSAIAYDTEDFGALRDINVVFDVIGGDVHERSYPVLKRGGTMIWLHALPIVDRGETFGVNVRLGYTGADDDPDVLAKVIALTSDGTIVPQVAGTMPLSEAAEAHRLLQAGAITRGRLVLTIPG
jgi:NADPH:quinone reductase-like Zn-dependent oxidoreductase